VSLDVDDWDFFGAWDLWFGTSSPCP
jgi:hypothetical protein